jgi:uncharacterized OB-fold protein
MTRFDTDEALVAKEVLILQASRDAHTGQVYIPPRALAADGSLRPTQTIEVPAQGVLYSVTSFAGETYGLVDLDCGTRLQVLLEPDTAVIGARVAARGHGADGKLRFAHA